MRIVNFTTMVILFSKSDFSQKNIFLKVIKIPDITKSNREAIVLRCPKGGSRGRKPPAGSGALPQRGLRGGAPS